MRQLIATKKVDPVCRMVVPNGSPHSKEFRGLTFYFCSQQCSENFSANPDLYVGLHHRDSDKPILKTRKIRVKFSIRETGLAICNDLALMMGVSEISLNENALEIVYDLRQLTWNQIEEQITSEGGCFKGFWSALRRAIWRFTEENELSNLSHWVDAECCNHPPTGFK